MAQVIFVILMSQGDGGFDSLLETGNRPSLSLYAPRCTKMSQEIRPRGSPKNRPTVHENEPGDPSPWLREFLSS